MAKGPKDQGTGRTIYPHSQSKIFTAMNQVIELPIWLLLFIAIASFVLGMIAEVSAQRHSLKEQNKKKT